MNRGLIQAALVTTILLGGAGVGQAQTEGDEQARQHFEIGRRYYDMGRFAEAAREFEQAYELSERPALLMNIYLSYRDAADPANAARSLRLYLSTDEVDPAQRPTLEVRLQALERQAEQAEQASASSGDGSPSTGSSGSSPDLVPPIIVLAAGAAVLLAGVGTGIGTIVENGSLEDACPNRVCSDAEAGRIDTVRALGITTDVLLGVGLAAVAAGVVWLVVSLGEGGGDDASAELGCAGTGCFARGSF